MGGARPRQVIGGQYYGHRLGTGALILLGMMLSTLSFDLSLYPFKPKLFFSQRLMGFLQSY